MLSLAVTATAIVVVSLLMFRPYGNSIIVERARVGMAVLQDTLAYMTFTATSAVCIFRF